jgi:hypothetical protein
MSAPLRSRSRNQPRACPRLRRVCKRGIPGREFLRECDLLDEVVQQAWQARSRSGPDARAALQRSP